MARDELRAYAALTGTVMIWGSAYPLTALAERYASPVALAAIRAIGGGLFLAALVGGRLRPSLRALAGGLINIAGMVTLLNLAVYLVPNPSVSAVLIYTQPIFTALLTPLLLGRAVSPAQYLGVVVGLGGIALMADASGPGYPLGLLLGVLGGLVWSLGTIYYERYLSSEDPVASTAFMSLSAFPFILLFSPLGLWIKGSVNSAALLAYIAVVVQGGGWALWFYGVKRLGGVRAGSFTMLTPIAAIAFTALLMRRYMTGAQLLGSALIIAGSAIVLLFGSRVGASSGQG